MSVMVLPQMATKQHAAIRSLPPGGIGDRIRKVRKLIGCDKDSLKGKAKATHTKQNKELHPVQQASTVRAQEQMRRERPDVNDSSVCILLHSWETREKLEELIKLLILL